PALTSPTQTHSPSLHDALPIYEGFITPRYQLPEIHPLVPPTEPQQLQNAPRLLRDRDHRGVHVSHPHLVHRTWAERHRGDGGQLDRKSTRLNSSHVSISYAVFC